MFDALTGGAMTLIVLFALLCGVVVVIEYFPVLGVVLLVLFFLMLAAALMSFTDKRR